MAPASTFRWCLAAVLAGTACDRPAATPPPSITIAVRGDVTGIFPNPPVADEAYTYDIGWNVFEGLVAFDARLEPAPALAERWENPDERTYLFHLRPGLRFSDGRPVGARDVVASLLAARRRGWVNAGYLQSIESVRALDAGTVEVRTRFPYFVLLSKLPWGMVLPADEVEKTPVPTVGTGPYRLESRTVGRDLVLARNPYYRGSPAGYERARFQVEPDAGTRVALVLEGRAQVADHVPLDRVDELRAHGLRVFSGPTLRVIFLGLRLDTPAFRDRRVREAVDLAIDREELIRRAYGGRTVPASQIVPPAVVGHHPGLRPRPADRERARQLLAAAGVAPGLALRLDGPFNRYVHDREMLHEVARQLGEVGIRVEVNAMDKRDFFPLVFGGRSGFHLLGWECQSGEAGQALDALAHSSTAGLGSANTTGLADPALDALIAKSNATTSAAERTQALQAAMARLDELRVLLPLVVQAEAMAVSPEVDWEPGVRYSLKVSEMRPRRR